MTINERNTRIFQGKLIDTTDINIVLRPGELSTDLTTYTLFVHDGVTPGGRPLSHGAQGPAGISAYQVAINNGFHGTEAQWLASLVGPQGPAGAGGAPGGGTGTNYGIVTSSTEIVITTDYLGQQSGLLGHILNVPLNTLNQQIQSGWQVIFADGQTTATVGSAYTNGDHITLNLNVPGGSIFVQPAYPITVIGTTRLGATATNVVIPGYGLILNPDGTLSVNSATIQGLLPIYEIGGNPGITTIDNNLAVQGIVAATAVTVSNFISFPDGSIQTTAALSGKTGFGLQKNQDGTISVNSATIQLLLPILEITNNNTSTTVIDNNTIIHGLIAGYALTVTNAIYFPDGTSMITAATGNGGGGGISTATVTALIANSLTNYTATPFKLTSSTQVVSLDSSGTLHTPLMFPKVFTATLVPVRHSGDAGAPAWDFEIHFVPGQDGDLVTQINNPVRFNNPGYQSGDSYTFTEADHGIPGYSFTITLNNVTNNQAGWTANLAVSPPPAYPNTIKSSGAFKLSTGTKNWVFGTGGRLTLPTAVTGIPTAITLVRGGSTMVGYTNATYPTYVNSGSGHGMTVDVLSNGTSISQVTINQPGSGYNVGDHVFVDGGTGTGEFTVDSVIDYAGGIVFPDNTLQTTAFTGSNGSLIQSATAPATTSTSTLWYDTVGGRSYVYFDNSWVDASPIATASATTSTLVNGSHSVVNDGSGALVLNDVQYIYPSTAGKDIDIYTNSTTSSEVWLHDDGPVQIITNGGAYIWNFAKDGSLTFPNNSVFDGQTLTDHATGVNYTLKIANGGAAGSKFGIGTGDAAFGIANDALNHAENGYVPYTITASRINLTVPGAGSWVLDNTGNLTFPDNTQQTTAYPGTKIGGAINIGTTSSNIFIPNTNNQALGLINSLAGVYIEAGTPQKVWQFNTDGTLTLPGSLTGDSVSIQGAPVTITITDTGGVWGGAIGVYTRLNGITPPKWAPANYNPGSDSSITYNGGWQLNNPNFGHPVYVNTGTLFTPSATWNPDTQYNLGSGNPAGAYTYKNWTFGSDGTLKVPGTIYAQASDNGSIVFSDDGSTDHGSIKVDGGHNMVINAESNYYVKRNGQDRLGITDTDTTLMAGRNLILKSNKNSTEQVWSFNSNGSLTFPDNTQQTTAFTASSYISKATLQSIISTCTSFTEFKNAILGL